MQDMYDFLAAWFAGDPSADVNHNGEGAIQDVFDFLGTCLSGTEQLA